MKYPGGMKTRTALVCCCILAVLSLAASSAGAETTDQPSQTEDNLSGTRTETETSSDGNSAGAEATETSTVGGSPGTGPRRRPNYSAMWDRYCRYTTNTGVGGDYAYVEGNTVVLSYAGPSEIDGNALYRADCNRESGTAYGGGIFDLPEGSGVGAVDPILLRNTAAARIVIEGPGIETNPSFNERHAVVRLETWLWVTDPWDDRIESESAGGVEVEVTASPTQVVWEFSEPGSPGPVICNGPGAEWGSGSDTTDCGYTFTRSSAGHGDSNAFTGSATISWNFSWTLNDVPQGSFAVVDGDTPFEIQVGEIQAIES